MTLTPASPPPALSQERASGIVRQRVHDLRNYMNGLDLQAQLLTEMVEDKDALQIVHNMRRQIQELETSVKWLSIQFSPASVSQVAAWDLIQLWQQQVNAMVNGSRKAEWNILLKQEVLEVDLRAVVAALRELAIEAWKRAPAKPLQIEVGPEASGVVVEVRASDANLSNGSGALNDIVRVLEASRGRLEVMPSGGGTQWVARISFECVPS